ncbi:hypothetical protein [Spongiibacter sp.]|uniref:DoxX family protein n=1 Tax=Spongiibacter sp. TaxID=2024860 RepID=UPI003564A88F
MKTLIRVLICLFFLAGGATHFLFAEDFVTIVPPFLPLPLWVVWITGVVELLMAPLVLVPRWRQQVGQFMAVYCLAVLPANIYQAITGAPGVGGEVSESVLWLRIPLQFVLIAAILWATTESPGALIRRSSRSVEPVTRG